MTYVEGFVVAVPTANKEAYRKHAADAAPLFKEFGVARMVEAWGDDVPDGKVNDFKSAVQAKPDETVPTHWSYAPIVCPTVPVFKSKWVRNTIDSFIVEKFIQRGVAPNVVASKETLLRRVTLDLTGLLPTAEERDAFLKDESPLAYEKVVERLLASPHYGENQARFWLDLARYADTNGYEADRIRQAFPFRDYVINAFNTNKPFDQFTIEQLAGDMMPNPTQETKVATGFHRNAMTNEEGGVDANESRYLTLTDRVGTTSITWSAVWSSFCLLT